MTPTTIANAIRGIAAARPEDPFVREGDGPPRCRECRGSFGHMRGCKNAGSSPLQRFCEEREAALLALADEIEASDG